MVAGLANELCGDICDLVLATGEEVVCLARETSSSELREVLSAISWASSSVTFRSVAGVLYIIGIKRNSPS